jgi:N-6 DNA Methylase
MKSRKLNQFAAMAAARAAEGMKCSVRKTKRPVLIAIADEMRRRRGLPTGGKPAGECLADLFDNPEVQTLFDADDGLGQMYQALNAPELEAAYLATAKDGRKFEPEEIPVVSQLFTPDWVVRFLLHNTLGRLWLEWHPESALRGRLDWLIPFENERSSSGRMAGDIRVCDPACGTMNFGLVAFDLLREMYREEIDQAGRRGWPDLPAARQEAEIPALIPCRNLVGVDIDPLALELAHLSLEIKAGRTFRADEVNLRLTDALFDSELDGAGGFDVVATNPPYLAARNLPRHTVARMRERYPVGWRDSYACFLLRCLELLRPRGRAGILTMQSFMFTGGFSALRRRLTDQAAIEAIAHFGPGLFDMGNPGTLQTAAMVMRREAEEKRRSENSIAVFGLAKEIDKRAGLEKAKSKPGRMVQGELERLPRGAWAYWASPAEVSVFATCKKLGEIAPPRQGLATTDNARFVRWWWEVESPGFAGPRARWVPYVKSGRFRRWYEAPRHRVDWEHDGRRIKQSIVARYPYLNGKWAWVAKNAGFYGKPGVTYSYLTSGKFSARQLQAGAIFDVAGSSLFPKDPLPILGLLNSAAAGRLLQIINPTVNFQVGDLGLLPVPEGLEALSPLVAQAIEIQRTLDGFDETSTDFLAPPPWGDGRRMVADLNRRLSALESQIDAAAADLYGLPNHVERSPLVVPPREDHLAWQWISFAVGSSLGRWGGESSIGPAIALAPLERKVRREVMGFLESCCGTVGAGEIAATVGGLEEFLTGPFYSRHVKQYEGRPIWWAFADGRRVWLIPQEYARAQMLRGCGISVPVNWRRNVDVGVLANLVPLADSVANLALRRSLARWREKNFTGRAWCSEALI